MSGDGPAERGGSDETDQARGSGGDVTDTPASGGATGSGPAVLVALVIFLLSLVGYPVALALGVDVTWAVGSNAAATVAIVAWTARRTFLDPTSSVTSVPGALGTALLVLGVYGLLVSGVIALTGGWHDADSLVGPIGVVGLVTLGFGLATFALEVVFGAPGAASGESGDGEGGHTDEQE